MAAPYVTNHRLRRDIAYDNLKSGNAARVGVAGIASHVADTDPLLPINFTAAYPAGKYEQGTFFYSVPNQTPYIIVNNATGGRSWAALISSSGGSSTFVTINTENIVTENLLFPLPTKRIHLFTEDDIGTNWEPANETTQVGNALFIHSIDETAFNEYGLIEVRDAGSGSQGMYIQTADASTYGGRIPEDPPVVSSFPVGGMPLFITAGNTVNVSSGTNADLTLQSGSGGFSNDGGDVFIATGAGGITGANSAGDMFISGGNGAVGGGTGGSITISPGTGAIGADGEFIYQQNYGRDAYTLGSSPFAFYSTLTTGSIVRDGGRLLHAPITQTALRMRVADSNRDASDITYTAPTNQYFNGYSSATRTPLLGAHFWGRNAYFSVDSGAGQTTTLVARNQIKIPWNNDPINDIDKSNGGGYLTNDTTMYDTSAWASALVEIESGGDDALTGRDYSIPNQRAGMITIPKAGWYRFEGVVELDMTRVSISTDAGGFVQTVSINSITPGPVDDTMYLFLRLITINDGTVNTTEYTRHSDRFKVTGDVGASSWSYALRFNHTDYFEAGEVVTWTLATTENFQQIITSDSNGVLNIANVNHPVWSGTGNGTPTDLINDNAVSYVFGIDANSYYNVLTMMYQGLSI